MIVAIGLRLILPTPYRIIIMMKLRQSLPRIIGAITMEREERLKALIAIMTLDRHLLITQRLFYSPALTHPPTKTNKLIHLSKSSKNLKCLRSQAKFSTQRTATLLLHVRATKMNRRIQSKTSLTMKPLIVVIAAEVQALVKQKLI